MKRLLLSVVFVCLGFSVQSNAQSYVDGSAGALQANHDVYQKLTNVELESLAQFTLNTLVKEGNDTLAENGYAKEAQEYQAEWDRGYSTYLTSQVELFDLGDHRPLNAWLADYYKKLQERLGDPILRLVHLDDLNAMNYATPVVFQPNGDKRNGDHWNSAEYGKHFVPFASITTYWAAYIGCRVATKAHPALKKFCGVAASTLKQLMKSTFAPKLSKVVYAKTTGKKADDLANDVTNFDDMATQQVNQIPRE